MVEKIRRLIRGEYDIQAEGIQLGRFTSLLLKKGILCRNTRKEDGFLYFTIRAKDKATLENCAEKTGTVLHFLCERGKPAWKRKSPIRVILWSGLCVIFGIILFLSNHIWEIEIVGLENIRQTEMLARLEQYGLKEGVWKGALDIEEIRQEMLEA